MKALVVVESPNKAQSIQQYLKNDASGTNYTVVSSKGHVRQIPSRSGCVDVNHNFEVQYEVIDKSARELQKILQLAKTSDEIYLATDPDREGEGIGWHINEELKKSGALKRGTQVKRVVFYEITPKAVKAALNNPRALDTNLIEAQQTRQTLDYLIGYQLSPILWLKLPGSRSAGRVQSVALRLICEREAEIIQFKTQEYWNINVILQAHTEKKNSFSANLKELNHKKLDKFFITNAEQANNIRDFLDACHYKVINIEKKQQKRSPAPPFITSTLLQEAVRKLHFSAKKTAQIAQKLYEGIDLGGGNVKGLITYMRTDSVIISADAAQDIGTLIQQRFGNDYYYGKQRFFRNKVKNAQEAHECIRPTNIELAPEQLLRTLDSDCYRLYKLIWERTVASQMSDLLFESTIISISASKTAAQQAANNDKINAASATEEYDSAQLQSIGRVITFPGFTKIYFSSAAEKSDKTNKNSEDNSSEEENSDEKEQTLPKLDLGDALSFLETATTQHFTKPPARYNEASLVRQLEELGIGRPSTYPTIMSLLKDRQYVRIEKNTCFPENRGILVCGFLLSFFQKYVSYDFTANLENELDEISNGERARIEVLQGFWTPFKTRTDEVQQLKSLEIMGQLEQELQQYIFPHCENDMEKCRKCPQCATGQLALKNSKFGGFLGCSNYPECNYIRDIIPNNASAVIGDNSTNAADGDSSNSMESSSYKDSNSRNFDAQQGQSGNSAEKFNTNPAPGQQLLGVDPQTNERTVLCKGPYGFYVQLQDLAGTKIKNAALPKGQKESEVTYEIAQNLLSLPRLLGKNLENDADVLVMIGKFGPFIKCDSVAASIKKDEVFTIELEEALDILQKRGKTMGTSAKQKGKKEKATATSKATAASKATKNSDNKKTASKTTKTRTKATSSAKEATKPKAKRPKSAKASE